MFVLVTRGRPWALKRFMDAYETTKAVAPVLVYCDDDDPTLLAYCMIVYPKHWIFRKGPRLRPGPTYNRIFQEFQNESYYGLLSDDVVPLTPHWDQLLIDKAGRKEFSFPYDSLVHDETATHPVIGGDLVRAAGFLSYPPFMQYFIDSWWFWVAEKLKISHYMGEVEFDHRHHTNKKAEVDDTYRGKWEHAASDTEIYKTWCENPDEALIEKIRSGLQIQNSAG